MPARHGGGKIMKQDPTPVEENPTSTPSGRGESDSPIQRSIGQSSGCTLAQYASAKCLPEEFLKDLGLSTITYCNHPAVRIPYTDENGTEPATRFRLAMHDDANGTTRFSWKKGSKPSLYGLSRLNSASNSVVLVEGESDCHTLWHQGVSALGGPGASSWKEERDAPYLADFETIFVVIEPDKGGAQMLEWLAKSSIRDRVQLVRIQGAKDVSDLHIADPDGFMDAWESAQAVSTPWSEHSKVEQAIRLEHLHKKCGDLASCHSILDKFADTVQQSGVVGEECLVKLLYLALTSRVLDRPVSMAVKGPSSGGKSYTTEKVTSFFPPDAYYALTAMSDRALAYGNEPLKNRFLVIYEATGMQSEIASYLIRSLLSEGRVRYETVEKTNDGFGARLIEREGPTGLIITTTQTGLHPENETRLLSITVTDTPDQTRQILRSLARQDKPPIDASEWHSLQEWIATGNCAVTIPFAEHLAELVPPSATRLRRDFSTVLSLIKAHAILHRASRQVEDDGRIIATLEDYAVVRELVVDLISEGVNASVSKTVRETVEAIAVLTQDGSEATKKQVADQLNIDPSAAWRRVKTAVALGYVINQEDKRGKPARLIIGDQLPDDVELLPIPEALEVNPSEQCAGETDRPAADEIDPTTSDCTIDPQTPDQDTPPMKSGTSAQSTEDFPDMPEFLWRTVNKRVVL